ncbi:MAG: hypothetical protein MZW92_47255 [Comamonadaceae bacterium]|nr:hypothetical protein [Comamonadaceae bacterium]
MLLHKVLLLVKKDEACMHATMFAVDVDEVMMCVDEAGMQLSDEGQYQ